MKNIRAILLSVTSAALLFSALPLIGGTESDEVARWLWHESSPVNHSTRYFRLNLDLADQAVSAPVTFACDDIGQIYVNGRIIGKNQSQKATRFNLAPYLKPGRNVIALSVSNVLKPAGIIMRGEILLKNDSVIPIFSGDNVQSSAEGPEGWNSVNFDDSRWSRAVRISEADASLLNRLTDQTLFLPRHEGTSVLRNPGRVLLDDFADISSWLGGGGEGARPGAAYPFEFHFGSVPDERRDDGWAGALHFDTVAPRGQARFGKNSIYQKRLEPRAIVFSADAEGNSGEVSFRFIDRFDREYITRGVKISGRGWREYRLELNPEQVPGWEKVAFPVVMREIIYRNDQPAKSRILLDDLYAEADLSETAQQISFHPDYAGLAHPVGMPVTMTFRIRNGLRRETDLHLKLEVFDFDQRLIASAQAERTLGPYGFGRVTFELGKFESLGGYAVKLTADNGSGKSSYLGWLGIFEPNGGRINRVPMWFGVEDQEVNTAPYEAKLHAGWMKLLGVDMIRGGFLGSKAEAVRGGRSGYEGFRKLWRPHVEAGLDICLDYAGAIPDWTNPGRTRPAGTAWSSAGNVQAQLRNPEMSAPDDEPVWHFESKPDARALAYSVALEDVKLEPEHGWFEFSYRLPEDSPVTRLRPGFRLDNREFVVGDLVPVKGRWTTVRLPLNDGIFSRKRKEGGEYVEELELGMLAPAGPIVLELGTFAAGSDVPEGSGRICEWRPGVEARAAVLPHGKDPERFREHITHVAEFMKSIPQIRWFEWFNEPNLGFTMPNEAYMEGLRQLYPIVKRIAPGVQVGTGGLVIGAHPKARPGFVKQAYVENAASYDIAFYHAHDGTANYRKIAGEVLGMIGDKPFANTETGFRSYHDSPELFYNQARVLVQKIAFSRSIGMTFYIWFMMQDYWDKYINADDSFGLVTVDNQPKPSFVAYNELIRQLANTTPATGAELDPRLESFRFTGSGEEVFVAWPKRDDARFSFCLKSTAPVRLIDIFGNVEELRPVDGIVYVNTKRLPFYLRSREGAMAPFGELVLISGDTVRLPGEERPLNVTLRNPYRTAIRYQLKSGSESFSGEIRSGSGESIELPFRVPADAAPGTLSCPVTVVLTAGDGRELYRGEVILHVSVALGVGTRKENQLIELDGEAVLTELVFDPTTPRWGGRDDLSAQIRLFRDGGDLVFEADVRDQDHSAPDSGAMNWRNDSIQIALANAQGEQFEFTVSDGPDNRPVAWCHIAPDGKDVGEVQLPLSIGRGQSVTRYRFSIPLATVGISPVPGERFRLSLLVNDNDGGKRVRIMEFFRGIEGDKNVGLFGWCELR